MVDYTAQFLTICGLHLLAVASPGPDFAVIVKQSVRHGRAVAIWTSVGIGTGIFFHTAYTLLGLGLLVKSSWLAFTIMKFAAAAYLAWLGIKALLAKPRDANLGVQAGLPEGEKLPPGKLAAYATGFLTNALNPKATLFFVAVFSVVVNPATPRLIQAGYGVWMAVITALWFTLVSVFFTQIKVRTAFLKMGHWFDRAIGVVLISLCVILAFTSFKK